MSRTMSFVSKRGYATDVKQFSRLPKNQWRWVKQIKIRPV